MVTLALHGRSACDVGEVDAKSRYAVAAAENRRNERNSGAIDAFSYRGFSENFVGDAACCALANEHREESKTSTGQSAGFI